MLSWLISPIVWIVLFAGMLITLGYQRAPLRVSSVALGVFTLLYLVLGDWVWVKLLLLLITAAVASLNFPTFRRQFFSKPIFKVYKKILPRISDTEREALNAGSVWWDGELFSGTPNWNELLDTPAAKLTEREQAFLDGPVEELCEMINDWEITHELADLPESIWQFMKDKKFFAMIIPQKYGGLEFSALAHSEVLSKVAGRSATAASIIAVPNSLGPAELLLHYGTEEQKNHYLPRLAKGEEIPCFALTSPRAGSDATSISDSGVVCKGTFDGKEVIGLKLNWQKRYITLAPVATVLGLAFKMHDPDHLLGDKEDYGITCALIPTDLPGIDIGRRHFPLNTPFQNGPTSGKDVFVPLDFIIGGEKMAGQGWRMLVESLTVGRCISLPSNATGTAKMALAGSSAYARIRKQFNLPIGRFEGIQEVMARITGLTYMMEAARTMTAGAVDQGHQPAVVSAILKYHLTEMGRKVVNDAMDVQGGKAICLGPKNYLGRSYQAIPISITVEGANIMTRSLMIFGQGAIRCHPYVLRQMQAAMDEDEDQGLDEFDDALLAHIGHACSTAARGFWLGLTLSRFSASPGRGQVKRYYQHINRFSADLATLADAAMLTMGGGLKRREMLSARLGDALSYLYLASAVLKRFEDQGRPEADLPVVQWACRYAIYQTQEQLHSALRNFPNRIVALLVRFLIFPRGLSYHAPADKVSRTVSDLMINPSATRNRLTEGVYKTLQPNNPIGLLEEAMQEATLVEPIEKRIREAVKDGTIKESNVHQQIADAVNANVINEQEAQKLKQYDEKIMNIIHVDDFDSAELAANANELAPRKTLAAAS